MTVLDRKSSASGARRGRPRSDTSRQAILSAALDLVAEVGYRATTVEGIAGRSGTGKQTIYRWWHGKADVVLEALTADAARVIPVPDTGDLRADLRAFLDATYAAARRPGTAPVLRALMAEAQLDPQFRQTFDARFLRSRRDALTTLLRRHSEQLRVPVGTAAEVVFGVLWYRILGTHRRLDAALARDLVELLVAPGAKR
jgi:AcrR family transcriptional regulator